MTVRKKLWIPMTMLLAIAGAFAAVSVLPAVGEARAEAAQAQDGTGSVTQDAPKKEQLVHEVPKVPTKIDGVQVEPQKVKDYDGKPLYYVVDPGKDAGQEDDTLQVFSNEKKAREHARKTAASRGRPAEAASDASAQSFCPVPLGSGRDQLYEHPCFGGKTVDFGHDENVPDFRRVKCFLWVCTNYNDKASSIVIPIRLGETQTRYAILHEHINYGGSQLWIPRGFVYDDLGVYGWNDRASSLSHTWGNPGQA